MKRHIWLTTLVSFALLGIPWDALAQRVGGYRTGGVAVGPGGGMAAGRRAAEPE